MHMKSDWKTLTEAVSRHRKSKKRRGRNFFGAFGGGYGPAFPDGGNFSMSSSVGDGCGVGCGDGGGCCESVSEMPEDDDDDLTINDNDKLLYALRAIIENAKVAYEAVAGVPYDEDEIDDAENDSEDEPEDVVDDGPDEIDDDMYDDVVE